MTMPMLEIPAGARTPIGAPAQWLKAAAAADWRCQCATETGRPMCGRSHRNDEGHRCPRVAVGPVAVRLILTPAVGGALLLLCEPCAAGHARAAARTRAACQNDDGQSSLFDL